MLLLTLLGNVSWERVGDTGNTVGENSSERCRTLWIIHKGTRFLAEQIQEIL